MSCFDCIHSQPTGCRLNRPEFETYANCAAFEWEKMETEITPQGIETVNPPWGKSDIFNMDISGPASSINVQKGDGDGSNG